MYRSNCLYNKRWKAYFMAETTNPALLRQESKRRTDGVSPEEESPTRPDSTVGAPVSQPNETMVAEAGRGLPEETSPAEVSREIN
jgi:hypothetical protein